MKDNTLFNIEFKNFIIYNFDRQIYPIKFYSEGVRYENTFDFTEEIT